MRDGRGGSRTGAPAELSGAELIRPAVFADREWLKPLFEEVPELWAGLTWARFWKYQNPREHWDVIEGAGFVHWRLRQDGWRTLSEVAVLRARRREGHGERLVRHVGAPTRLKTDADNAASNALYRRLGYLMEGRVWSRAGKAMHVYALY